MSKPDIETIALQLESSNSKDRLLALASLREVTP
ncbi:MAG: HEAT repeat domain-containing protein, partial [Microcystis aeruginosa SX13-01]|nr:HEAT repeat domain-containing protein [Microcystis aeruginosa SX13-01]